MSTFSTSSSDRAVRRRAPVDDIITPVNQAFFIEPDKDINYSRGIRLVHGESQARPVAGTAQFLSCWMMVLPNSSFHCQTRSTNLVRPKACRDDLSFFSCFLPRSGWRSGVSVPGAQQVAKPCIREAHQDILGRFVPVSIWRIPVTLAGMTMEKGVWMRDTGFVSRSLRSSIRELSMEVPLVPEFVNPVFNGLGIICGFHKFILLALFICQSKNSAVNSARPRTK